MAKLESYTGSIELIAGLKPKSGGDFPLVQAHDIQIDEEGTRLDEYVENPSIKVDTTLTGEGQAADAKTVGDRLKAIEDKLSSGVVMGDGSNFVTPGDIDDMVGNNPV